MDSDLPKLAAPARRALAGAGYTSLDQLAGVCESELERLHGIGPTAIAAVREALAERGLSFRASATTPTPVDDYLRGLGEPERGTLRALRRTILEIVPEAEEAISYGVPAFRVGGHTVAGFAAYARHLSYLPFSGSVLGELADELSGYSMTKSALHFPARHPLPKPLVEKLIAARLAEADRNSRGVPGH